MCSGGGGGSVTAEKPVQPYRKDPDVQVYYNNIVSERNAKATTAQQTPAFVPRFAQGNQSIADKISGISASANSEYDTWEEANYMYQKDKTAAQYADQARQQQQYMDLQRSMGERQLEMQQSLQKQQIESQERLTAIQQQMQAQQLEQQRLLEEQRLKFEKDAAIAERDSKRNIDLATKQAKLQDNFKAGRKSDDRKNSGSVMATRGTKALQVGVNAGSNQSAGLGIPA